MIRDILLLTIFPGAMAFAAATDLFTMTVPNRIVLVLIAGFFIIAPMVGLGWADIGVHVALASVALLVTFGLFSKGWIGGGDAKLFAATCFWLGPGGVVAYSIYAALLGGALTLVLLFVRNMPLPATLLFQGWKTLLFQGWIVRLHSPKEGVPYGIALAAAGLMVYPETPFMAALAG